MILNSRDEARNGHGEVVWYRQWPDAVDGMVDDNGTMRPLTADETAEAVAEVVARTADTNGTTIRTAAAQALAVNRDFLALDTPTSAQVVAQVRALTRQCQALIRLQLGDLSGTD